MSVSDQDIEFVTELFAGVGPLTTRKMFGGLGIYCDGKIFAIIGPDEKIFVKASGDLVAALEAQGATQWAYEGKKGKPVKMPYWTLPDAALDDPTEASDWGRKAFDLLT